MRHTATIVLSWMASCLAVVLLLGSACTRWSPGARDEPLVVIDRLVETEPHAYFIDSPFQEIAQPTLWQFHDEGELENWLIRPETLTHAIEGQALRLNSSAGWVRLVRKVSLNSLAVLAIEVELEGALPAERLWLSWASSGEPFDRERRITSVASGRGTTIVHQFPVSEHPLWMGRVGRLRLDLQTDSEQVLVRRIDLVRAGLDRFRGELARAWKIDLGHEVRNALLTPPGQVVIHQLTVPPRALLRTAIGLVPGASGVTEFRITAIPAEGAEALLFSKAVRSWLSADRWHEVQVDLDEFAGQDIQLRLEAQSDGEEVGFPAWAHPEILQRETRADRPNIILISVDTLRSDHLSLYGYERPTSPRLDAWAERRAVAFRNVVAPAPWTLPSHISMFTGLDPLSHGSNFNDPASSSLLMLAEVLRASGYSTVAWTGGGFLHPRFGLAQGFDLYRYWEHRQLRNPPSSLMERLLQGELESNINSSLAWLERASEPFFLFLHTYEVHSPYHRREPYFSRLGGSSVIHDFLTQAVPPREEDGFLRIRRFVSAEREGALLSEREIDQVRRLYDSGIAFTDSHLGRLFDVLQQSGLEERTIVVLTSDHGEALGEKGLADHAYLYDFNLMVPLVIAAPAIVSPGTMIDQQVSLVDIVPTVLELAGLAPPGSIDGVSLQSSLEGRPTASPREAWSYAASTNHGIAVRVSNRLKLVLNNSAWEPLRGRETVFDLRRDPAEVGSPPGRTPGLESLRRRIHERLAEYPRGLHVRLTNPAGPMLRGRLLGRELVHPDRLKAVVPSPTGRVTWNERGTASFEVASGGSLQLFLENRTRSEMGIEIEQTSQAEEFKTSFLFGEIGSTLYLMLDPRQAKWVETDHRPDSSVPALELTWRGLDPEGPASQPLETDQALREQLKALGYLD